MLILQKYTRKTSYDMTILTPLDFLIIFPIFFGVFNLAVPFIIKESIKIRNILLIQDPTPQDPANSYATRNVSSDYYNYSF